MLKAPKVADFKYAELIGFAPRTQSLLQLLVVFRNSSALTKQEMYSVSFKDECVAYSRDAAMPPSLNPKNRVPKIECRAINCGKTAFPLYFELHRFVSMSLAFINILKTCLYRINITLFSEILQKASANFQDISKFLDFSRDNIKKVKQFFLLICTAEKAPNALKCKFFTKPI